MHIYFSIKTNIFDFFYERIKVSRQIQGVPSFLVTHNSPLEKKIETFIQDYHDESLAYLVSALVVESKELSNKYLNLALDKKPRSPLLLASIMAYSPTLIRSSLDSFLGLWSKEDPDNAAPDLWRIKLYLEQNNEQKASHLSEKAKNKELKDNFHQLYKPFLTLCKELGVKTTEAQLYILGKISSLRVGQLTPLLHPISQILQKNDNQRYHLKSKHELSIVLYVANTLGESQSLLTRIIGSALAQNYWEYKLQNTSDNILLKGLDKKFSFFKKQGECYDSLRKSLNITSSLKNFSQKELRQQVEKIIFDGEYKTYLSFQTVQKEIQENKCESYLLP